MVKLIIFDVCWTMYKSNTTFDFIKYVYKVEGINSFKLDFLNSLIGRFLILLLGKLVGRDIYRELFVDLLKGFSKESLEKSSERFYNEFLIEKKVDYTFNLINSMPLNSIILCSASLDIVVEHIAKMLNADFFASKLEFKNGICTGRISNDLLGAKNKIFEYENIDLVVTDNLSDLELVKKSSKSIILSTPKNIGFWERNGLTVDYILED